MHGQIKIGRFLAVACAAGQQQPAKFIACFICDNHKPVTVPINGTHTEGGK
jgi:hypothetical protein